MKRLNIPSRYKVFCVVSLGYPNDSATGRKERSGRFDTKNVFYQNKFGNRFENWL